MTALSLLYEHHLQIYSLGHVGIRWLVPIKIQKFQSGALAKLLTCSVMKNVNSQKKTVVCVFTVNIPIIHVIPSSGSNTMTPFIPDLSTIMNTIGYCNKRQLTLQY